MKGTAVCFLEVLVSTYQATWSCNLQYHNMKLHDRENLKC